MTKKVRVGNGNRFEMKSLCAVFKVHTSMREWLSGGVSPCQGEGRGFESRLALLKPPEFDQEVFLRMIGAA